jgi:hypothetical protein
MAWVLETYRKQERLSQEQLITQLKTTPPMLERLALCRRPDSEMITFAQQVRQLADYAHIDAALISSVLRQVDALEIFTHLSPVTGLQDIAPEQTPKRSWRSAFAAARDREDQETQTNTNTSEDDLQGDK